MRVMSLQVARYSVTLPSSGVSQHRIPQSVPPETTRIGLWADEVKRWLLSVCRSMIKLFSLKQQSKDGNTAQTSRKTSAAYLRIQKDLADLNLPKTCQMDFPDPDDLLNFRLVIMPDEGFYRHGRFVFGFKVSQGYPHDAPKVKCETQVYHPNIDLEGNVCLNILREDWKPVLTISSIIYGLQFLFLEPNPDDPLNKDAAEVLRQNRRLFEQNVAKSMRGGYVGSVFFERCLLK